MTEKTSELYFKNDDEWQKWAHENHCTSKGVYLIFYKVDHEVDSMPWEEAVKVALCYGWMDSTVKVLEMVDEDSILQQETIKVSGVL